MNRYDLYYQAPPAGQVLPSGVSENCRKTHHFVEVYVGICYGILGKSIICNVICNSQHEMQPEQYMLL